MKLRHLLPGLDARTHPDIDMRPAMVTWFGDQEVLQRVKGPPMSEGPVLGLDVTYEFLAAVRRQRGILEDTDDEEEDVSLSAADALSPETKKYLQSYGLSKVSIATVVRWMHATGFRYRNRS